MKLEIEMDNAAFELGNGIECARILRKLANKIEYENLEPGDGHRLADFNGNTVGEAKVTK